MERDMFKDFLKNMWISPSRMMFEVKLEYK